MTITLQITCEELCGFDDVNEEIILAAVEHAVLNPQSGTRISDWVFSIENITWFRRALRLQRDLEIDWIAAALIIELLQQKEALAQENRNLQLRLDRFLSAEE